MVEGSKIQWRIAHTEASMGWGGQERRIMSELLGFKRRGSHVYLAAPDKSRIAEQARQAGIPMQKIEPGRLRFPLEIARLALWLRRERIQILNPHSSRDGWIAGLAGRLAGVPLIIRSRHFDVPIPNRWVSGIVYRRLADHIITTSPKVTAGFQDIFDLPPNRISTIPTGIDTAVFSPNGQKARLEFSPQSRGPLLGMIAVVRQAKGHRFLLQAMRLLRSQGFPTRCIMVGDGPMLKAVRELATQLNLDDSVLFAGYREDIPEILRALDVLVIPSLHEGVPQVALQALATCTPVVGSNVGGIPSVIRAGETGRLVPAGDVEALAAAIKETLTDIEKTQAMKIRGRQMVEAQYSLDGMLDKLEQLYMRLLGRNGGLQ